MFHALAMFIVGIGIFVAGSSSLPWSSPLMWLSLNFFVMGIALARKDSSPMGKNAAGRRALWSRIFFFPYCSMLWILWHLSVRMSRESKYDVVNPRLLIGRRLLPSEIPEDIDNYVDFTSEFEDPRTVRESEDIDYHCLPILDASVPSSAALMKVLEDLSPGRTFVHCAQGHGRTALFAIALLRYTGEIETPSEGLALLKEVRPGVALSATQRQFLEDFFILVQSQNSSS